MTSDILTVPTLTPLNLMDSRQLTLLEQLWMSHALHLQWDQTHVTNRILKTYFTNQETHP